MKVPGKARIHSQRMRGHVLECLATVPAICGCMTAQVRELVQDRSGTMTLPKSSDTLSVRSYPTPSEDIASVPVTWNWPVFVLALPITLSWDLLTAPAQWAFGFHPYGDRLEP